MIRRLIALRFPSLGGSPELDGIQNTRRLEALFERLVQASTAAEARAVLKSLPKP